METIPGYREGAVAERALFARLTSLDDTEKFSYAEKGRICKSVRDGLLHQERMDPETGEPCSLSAWIRLAAPWGYATCFAAMRDLDALADVPMAELAKVPESNFPILKQLSTAVRNDPKVMEVAQTKRQAQLEQYVADHHPDQHIEAGTETLKYVAKRSQAVNIKRAIDEFMEENGTHNKVEALEGICVDYMAGKIIERAAR